uniref:Uncharacterized protein n=1 Tax=Opuntia streptacantha TaxID=393608 RepID=A0A7C8ZGQ8_OPUST
MSLPFGIFLVCIRNGNLTITEVLAIHCLNGRIRCLKGIVANKSKATRISCLRISHNLGVCNYDSKRTESIIKEFFIHIRVQITNEKICSNIQTLLVLGSLIYTYRFPINLDHVKNFNSIVGIFFTPEFHKSIALMKICHSIFGHIHINNGASLNKQFP